MKVSKGESLDRYYLFKLWGFGLFLHHIHHSDPAGLFHNHPWSGLSIIIGKYLETYPNFESKMKYFFNWIPATKYHRVCVDKPTWTLFFHLPKSNKWSVVDSSGNKVDTPWEGEGEGRSYSKAIEGKNDK
jgi:hypothetical protein